MAGESIAYRTDSIFDNDLTATMENHLPTERCAIIIYMGKYPLPGLFKIGSSWPDVGGFGAQHQQALFKCV